MRSPRRRKSKTNICITVEKEGVWVYGNSHAFQQMAKYMAIIAGSEPSEHHELHLRWHLGSHFTKRDTVFVLLDDESRRVHKRHDFEVTFMVVEESDLKRLRLRERSGRLPRDWDRSV